MPPASQVGVDCCQAFADSYEISNLPAMREIERHVLGCDFGGTSWTTRAQANEIAEVLGLRPGVHLLDIGAGSGWPGLYLARSSGCHVTLLDLPANALATADARAAKDCIAERVITVCASAASMPFPDGSFEVISHSDLLCCLPEKLEVLQECRRVATDDARMHFSLISVPTDLTEPERQTAIEAGPPFVESAIPYPAMLDGSGWRVLDSRDVTAEYRQSLRKLVDAFDKSTALSEALGQEVVIEASKHRRQQLSLVDRRHIVRETYLVAAA